MPLTLRLRHPLGEARYQFDARTGRDPLIVGRAPEAAVPVPHLRVGPRHCALFVHGGRWVLQDGNTRAGTRVNGRLLPGSRSVWPLTAGDLVELGDAFDGPTLLVEGADATESAPARPFMPPGIAVASEPIAARAAAALLQVHTTPPAVPPAISATRANAAAGDGNAPWSARPNRPRARASRAQSTPVGAIAVGAIGTLILAAGGVLSYRWLLPDLSRRPAIVTPTMDDDEPAFTTRPATRTAQPPAQSTVPAGDGITPAPATTRPLDLTADAAGLTEELAGLAPGDPRRHTDAWVAVATAHAHADPGPRLLAYNAYLASGKVDDPLRSAVAAWQEETFDELWWRRIRSLLDEEFALVDRRIEIEAELRLLPPGDGAGQAVALAEEQRLLRDRLSAVTATLAEMDYREGLSPNLGNESQLGRLRLGRNVDRYAVWKRELLTFVAENGGAIPWAGGVDKAVDRDEE